MGILKPFIEIIGKNIFLIPDYQRSFAWEDKQVKDLIGDIKESLEENLKHYLGQIILREKEKLQDYKLYEVIDGQQRLTSLLLFLLSFREIDGSNSLIKQIIVDNDTVKRRLRKDFNIDEYFQHIPILIPAKVNRKTFLDIFNPNNESQVELKTNRFLTNAYREFENFVKHSHYDTDDFWKLVNDIMLIVKFDVEEEANLLDKDYTATKIFLSINDRGKPLSILERLKALLMFHDFKNLNGKLKNNINQSFAEVFEGLSRSPEISLHSILRKP